MISERLKLIRKKQKLNQEEFSNKYNISRQALSRYETDRASLSDELKISLIMDGYNVNWLLTGKGQMYHEERVDEIVELSDALPIIARLAESSALDRKVIMRYFEAGLDDERKAALLRFMGEPPISP